MEPDMTDGGIYADDEARSDAEKTLDAVEYVIDNPTADDAADRLQGAVDELGGRRPSTEESLEAAIDDIEAGNADEAAAALASLKFALDLAVAVGE